MNPSFIAQKHLWRKLLMLFFFYCMLSHTDSQAFAERVVSGKVTTEDDSFLPGVNILVKGTSTGTTTDANGNYRITIPETGNVILQFSYLGFAPQEVEVGVRAVINIVLQENVETLQEAVVTALGIKREERSLGYSVEKVQGKEMNRVAQENVLNAMAGKVAGVTISSTGSTGSSVSMVIRGATSLNSDNQPLFVIDGVPVNSTLNNVTQIGTDNRVDYGNAIAGLNPDDIENVSILKGPSAAALYGSRAGNGVVIITTKSGQGVNKMTVNVNSNTVFDRPYRYLKWQSKFGPGLFSAIPADISGNPLTNPLGNLIDESALSLFGAELDKGYLAPQWSSPLDESGKRIPTPLVSYPDNVRNFVQTGITTTNGISVANSSANYNYRVSYANMSNKGIIPNSDLFRNTFNINSSMKVHKKLTLGTNLDISRNNSNNRPAGERGTNPLQWAYSTSPHVDLREMRDYWLPGQEGLQHKSYYPAYNNPYFLANEVKNSFVRDRVFGNIRAEWQVSKEFNVMFRYGLDTYNEERETRIAHSYTDDSRGVYGVLGIKHLETNADVLATYKKSIQDFSLSVSAGGNIRHQKGSNIRTTSKNQTGLIEPGLYTIQNILPANLDYSTYRMERGINSLYAMATLGYKDLFYLDVSGRNDWSSTLPNADPYFYPSASASLLVNELIGLDSKDVSMIKLRGGYAQVGNDAAPYQLLGVLGNAGSWGDVPRLSTPGTLLNPQLKPELSTSFEGGIDVNLFKNRVTFSGTVYRVDNENQIFNTQIPPSSGYTSKSINAGLLRSRGIELSLGGTPYKKGNLRWDVNLNLTRNRTRIIKLADEMPFFTFWTEAKGGAWTYVGEDVGDIYGPEVRTVKDENSPYYGFPLLELDPTYGWATVKVEKEGQASKNKLGNFNPKFILGAQTSLSWKRLRLDMTFDWRNGGNFVSQTYRYGMSNGQTSLALERLRDFGDLSGKELRDFLMANADEHVKINGTDMPMIGYPTPEKTTFPTYFGAVLPHGGVIIPGVYQAVDRNGTPQFNGDGSPIYVENLGENIDPGRPGRVTGTQPVPYAVAVNWDFLQPTLFDASYVKLREIALTAGLPTNWIKAMKLQDASVSVYSRNIILWTAAKINIDPENAFQPSASASAGTQFLQGVERYNVTPWVIPVGFKVNVTF